MSKQELKRKVCRAIDERGAAIKEIGEKIAAMPELGFKEFRTASLVSEVMKEFSVPHQTELAITGVKGVLQGKQPGPTVAVMGELDSLIIPDHPQADPETGAAHGCGHNAQIAGMLGAMMGVADAGVMDELFGRIVFFAVPAEEYVEVEYRMELVRQGKITFLGGKPELVRLGHFDDIDMALIIHTHAMAKLPKVIVGKSSNGCVVKLVRFEGRSSHAGNFPHLGINALNAANLAIAGIHAQRETFKDHDTVRIHPIITKGGDLVNIVPAEVRMESFVRGRTNKAIQNADMKVNRALRAGALAIGAKVTIETLPGYLPLMNHEGLGEIFRDNAIGLLGEDEFLQGGHGTGSTDLGDISHIMPALHPICGGASGVSHGADFRISDQELAYVVPAKLQAMAAIDLLYGNAEKGREILKEHKPQLTIKEYLDLQNQIFQTEVYDGESGESETTAGLIG